ncbi:hypothetical protein AYI68_g781 [Smittium mucronatum]|uniref:Uncharacterized protein n=1 Tax=Smittium mucronatum TaxID=133383 RepID=A0A1R0H793_9FUNG|nr:hypothetical protein AYI68_g781 [Smittium mucronatum]
MVGLTSENFTGVLKPKLDESSSKENPRSFVTGSPFNLTNWSKSSIRAGNSVEMDKKITLSLSFATSLKASTSR